MYLGLIQELSPSQPPTSTVKSDTVTSDVIGHSLTAQCRAYSVQRVQK